MLRRARQALDYARRDREGFVAHIPDRVDVKAARRRLGLSQRQFSERFGFRINAVQNEE